MKNKNFIIKIVMLVLILGGILGLSTNNVQAVPEEGNTIYLDNAGGNDANNGESEATAVKTFNKALELLGENGTLKVKSFDKQSGIVFNKKGTLEIIEDTTLQGNRTDIGITMKSGSHLRMAEGKTLKMKDFKTALTIENGAELNDGNYILENNASDQYGKGLNIIGAVKGSSGRDKLVLKANDIYNVNFYSGTATFENATIEVISQKRVWSDAKKLTMTNTSMTLSGYGQGFYIGGDSKIIDSYLYMKDPKGSWFNINTTGMTFQGTGSTISGSTLRVDYGSNAGISIGLSNANQILSMTNSTLEFNNSGQGGLNVNTGIVELTGTTIKTNERQRGALYGAQTNAKLIFNADTVVDSAANKDADNGLGQTNDNYVVIGGSHHVKYAPDYKPGGAAAGVAIPTNGVNNGNEKLRLFTLTDSTVTSLNPLNKNNTTYLYSIVKASADGKKYAWLPEVNVTFKLNAPDAKFQDNTSNDKVLRTYRGGKLSEVEGNDIPKDPTREGYTFLGWELKDSTDSFNTDVAVKEDLIYEAKWDKNPTPKNFEGTLLGDILIGDDTGHDKLHEEKAGAEIEYTGKIGVASIKNHIQTLANNYGGDINTITLNDIESTFTTKITLEDGLDISNVTEAIFTDNNLFEIKEFSKSGNVVTVKYGLKKNYTKFTDLLTDVTNVPDVLEIKLPKVKVKEDLANGTKLKVVGTVEGTFTGFAKAASGNREQYDFKWTAEQEPSGKDIEQAAGDTTTIQYTVLVIKQVTPPLPEPTPGEKTVNSENGNEGATVRQLTEKGEVFRYDIKTKLEENSNHHNQFSISDILDSVLQINKVAIKIDGAELDEDMVLPEYTQLKNKLQEATKKLEELAALEEKVNKLKSDVDKLETEYAAFPDKTVEEAKAVKIKLDNVKSELTIAKTKFEADKVNKPNLEKIVNDTKVEIEAFEKTDKFKLIRIINQALNSRNEKNEISADFVKKLGHLEIKGNTVEYLIDSPIILKQLDGRQITLSIYANILSGANLEKYIDKQHKVIKIANKAIITNNNVAKETNVVYVTLRVKDKPIIPNKPNKPNKPKKLPNTGKATADVAGLGLVGVTLAYLLARRKFNK